MAVPLRASLADLPKEHEFAATSVSLTASAVEQYLLAVGDTNACYRELGLAPPLAVAALALGALLEMLELPAGALHIGQELEVRGGVPLEGELSLSGRIAQRSERAGMVISVIEFDIARGLGGTPALTGRTTLMFPKTGG